MDWLLYQGKTNTVKHSSYFIIWMKLVTAKMKIMKNRFVFDKFLVAVYSCRNNSLKMRTSHDES